VRLFTEIPCASFAVAGIWVVRIVVVPAVLAALLHSQDKRPAVVVIFGLFLKIRIPYEFLAERFVIIVIKTEFASSHEYDFVRLSFADLPTSPITTIIWTGKGYGK